MKKIVIINGKEYQTKVNFAPIMSSEKIKNILQNIVLDNPELRNNDSINPITDIKLTYVGGKPETTLYINNNPYNFEIIGYEEKDYGFEHIWIKEGFLDKNGYDADLGPSTPWVYQQTEVGGHKFAILLDRENMRAYEAVWDAENERWDTDFCYSAVGVDSFDVAGEFQTAFAEVEKMGYIICE